MRKSCVQKVQLFARVHMVLTSLFLAGNQWFIRSTLISSLPDDIVNQTVLQFADAPQGCSESSRHLGEIQRFHCHSLAAWLFEIAGGAIADFEDTCLPKEKRVAAFTIAALHQWPMGVDEPRCVETAEEVSFFPVNPLLDSCSAHASHVTSSGFLVPWPL